MKRADAFGRANSWKRSDIRGGYGHIRLFGFDAFDGIGSAAASGNAVARYGDGDAAVSFGRWSEGEGEIQHRLAFHGEQLFKVANRA